MRFRWLIAGSALLALLVAAAGATAVRRALAPAGGMGPAVVFTVGRGEPLAAIANNLQRAGLVRNAKAVVWLARYRGLDQSLRAGEFQVSPAQTPDAILDHLAHGQVVTYEVAIPEGFRLEQIARRLEAAGLTDAAAFEAIARDPETAAKLGVDGETLEGYLYPETYRLPHGLDPLEVASVLVKQFLEVWSGIEAAAREQNLSMREVVILASIVEKESGVAEERPLIASVFRNRLARRMRLETDPTVIYGIENFDGNLRRSDLENAENPYNTYKIPGLPPGPIASPGAEALRAVVNPAESQFLYFVSRNDGTHQFSQTYREHEVAVTHYQRRGRR